MHFRINDLLQAYQLPQGNSKRSIVSQIQDSLRRGRRGAGGSNNFLGEKYKKLKFGLISPVCNQGVKSLPTFLQVNLFECKGAAIEKATQNTFLLILKQRKVIYDCWIFSTLRSSYSSANCTELLQRWRHIKVNFREELLTSSS